MDTGKRNKSVKISAAGVIGGCVVSILLTLLVNGFAISMLLVSNFMFTIGLFLGMAGGVWTVIPFFFLKAQLRKNPHVEKLEVEKKDRLPYEYMMIFSGMALILISLLIVIL